MHATKHRLIEGLGAEARATIFEVCIRLQAPIDDSIRCALGLEKPYGNDADRVEAAAAQLREKLGDKLDELKAGWFIECPHCKARHPDAMALKPCPDCRRTRGCSSCMGEPCASCRERQKIQAAGEEKAKAFAAAENAALEAALKHDAAPVAG